MKIIELGKATNIFGKAGNLNDLYNNFNIARGFIIPNKFFLKFLKFNNIVLSENFNVIKKKIMNGIFPNEKELLDYFNKNKYNKVIVRSSASLEDKDNFSFAGQFESYKNTTVKSLILNIKKCWASQFRDNIKIYIKENNLVNNFSIDILIQEMIISDISGIAFSVNPTNGCNEILVEISTAQCGELVGGNVIPHTYHIDKKEMKKNLISQDKYLIVAKNINKLKRIFKKEIEIEFCFKNNIFYLFQVRPITKIYFSLNDYINKEYWCCFKNNNWTLFNRSLWILGATKYKHKKVSNEITEDITLYYPHNQKQIRGFNGNQPPLNNQTIKNHTSNDINNYIFESYKISNNIKKLSNTINSYINNNDFANFNIYLKKLIKENALLNSYEYLIGSLGNLLYEKLDKATIKKIEAWRNNQDNSYFTIYNNIFNYIYNYFALNISMKLFKTYIHVNELINLCDNKIKPDTIIKRIKEREKEGFVLLNIRNKKYCNKVITEKETINIVKNRFNKLQEKNINNLDDIKGKSTFKNGKIINGECIVIKNNYNSIKDYDLKDKILICEITTAKDIPYIKNIKALIVNSGGVLCHSAIFSREFNIPCLMGCKNATEYFNTGDIISYNVDKESAHKMK